mgnify:CR=1 FL=1
MFSDLFVADKNAPLQEATGRFVRRDQTALSGFSLP